MTCWPRAGIVAAELLPPVTFASGLRLTERVAVPQRVAAKKIEHKNMKAMKPIMMTALVAGGLLAWGPALRAGDTNTPPAQPAPGTPAPGQRPPRPGGGFGRMMDQLDLSADQKPKVQAVLDEWQQKSREIRQNAELTIAERQTRSKALLDNMETGMKAVLTAEQYEKWQKMPHPGRGPRSAMSQPGAKAGGTNAPAAPPKP